MGANAAKSQKPQSVPYIPLPFRTNTAEPEVPIVVQREGSGFKPSHTIHGSPCRNYTQKEPPLAKTSLSSNSRGENGESLRARAAVPHGLVSHLELIRRRGKPGGLTVFGQADCRRWAVVVERRRMLGLEIPLCAFPVPDSAQLA